MSVKIKEVIVVSLFCFGCSSVVGMEPVSAEIRGYPRNVDDVSKEFLGVYSSYYKVFVTQIALSVDSTFSPSAKRVLGAAADLFLKNALKSEVIDCAYRKANKDLPVLRRQFELNQLLSSLTPPVGEDGDYSITPLVISRFWDRGSVEGLGYLNLIDWRVPPYFRLGAVIRYFYIALNSDFLGDEAGSYIHAHNSAYWAGVIAHQALHNLGYDHPTGRFGSFISEYSDCLYRFSAGATL